MPCEDGEGGRQWPGRRHRHPHLPHGRPHDHLPLRQVRVVPRPVQEQHGEPGLHQGRLQGQHTVGGRHLGLDMHARLRFVKFSQNDYKY